MSETIENNNTNTAPAPASNPAPAPAPAQGKVWTDEYVQGLREEAKTNRLARKAAEAKLKALIGLKDDEDIDDAKITAYQTKIQNDLSGALQKANDRLILAELRSLEGYDHKLIERLMTDKSGIKVGDDGTVTGVKEAVTALETEFPQIKLEKPAAPPPSGGSNPLGAGAGTERSRLEAELAEAQKSGSTALAVSLKNRLFNLTKP
jgi:hypothetical protein